MRVRKLPMKARLEINVFIVLRVRAKRWCIFSLEMGWFGGQDRELTVVRAEMAFDWTG